MNARDLKLTPPRNLTPEQLEKWNAAYGPKNEAFEAKLTGNDLIRWKYQRYIKITSARSRRPTSVARFSIIDETGLTENTVVIYNADQGFYLGEHDWFDKRWIYEESVRAARGPLAGVVKPGSVNTDLVANIDYAATFLEIAGAPVPKDLHGKSIVPILKGKLRRIGVSRSLSLLRIPGALPWPSTTAWSPRRTNCSTAISSRNGNSTTPLSIRWRWRMCRADGIHVRAQRTDPGNLQAAEQVW